MHSNSRSPPRRNGSSTSLPQETLRKFFVLRGGEGGRCSEKELFVDNSDNWGFICLFPTNDAKGRFKGIDGLEGSERGRSDVLVVRKS